MNIGNKWGCNPVTDKCDGAYGHWINAASQPWGKMFGTFKGYNRGAGDRDLTYVKSFVMTLYQDIPKEAVLYRTSVNNVDANAFRTGNFAWLLDMEKRLEIINNDEVNFPGVKVSFLPSNGIERMYTEVSSAQVPTILIGYGTMLVFVTFSQYSGNRMLNLMLVSFLGFMMILLGNIAAYALIGLAGIKFNHTMMQALPFLALGLGVDDLFLLLHAFKNVMVKNKGHSSKHIVALTMQHAGSSITITSISNAVVFFVACVIPVTALRNLLMAAATVVLLNWLVAMTVMPAVLSLWAGRFEDPNLKGTSDEEILTKQIALVAEEREAFKNGTSKAGLISKFYKYFSESGALKALFLGIGFALVVLFGALISQVELGYDEKDLAKKGTYIAQGIDAAYGQVFSQHSTENVVFGVGIDTAADQRRILDTHKALKDTSWSAYGTALGRGGVSANTWLENMYEAAGVCPHYNDYGDGTNPPEHFWEDFHLWRKPQVTLMPRSASDLAFSGLFAGLLDSANRWPYTLGSDDYTTANRIIMSWDEVEMDMTKLQKTKDKVAMVKEFKDITLASGVNIYMYGWLYVQIEQFVDLDFYFWQAVAVSLSVVFVISLCLGISFLGAALISLLSVAVCVQVYGSLAVLDISYQTLACTSLLISIGIAVEFVAHPVAAYEMATGTRNERLAQAMHQTAVPVLEGAFSSFLGFVFLAMSDFDFVIKYFLRIFFSIVVFGVINGLVFLPAILGIFGSDKAHPDGKSGSAVSTSTTK